MTTPVHKIEGVNRIKPCGFTPLFSLAKNGARACGSRRGDLSVAFQKPATATSGRGIWITS